MANITYFASFHRNNVFTQNEHEFKNYQLQKKLIFWHLGTKIVNFAYILGLITEYLCKKKKKIAYFKIISHKKPEFKP